MGRPPPCAVWTPVLVELGVAAPAVHRRGAPSGEEGDQPRAAAGSVGGPSDAACNTGRRQPTSRELPGEMHTIVATFLTGPRMMVCNNSERGCHDTESAGEACRIGISLPELAETFPDDEAAERWIANFRWPDGPRCQRCDAKNVQSGPRIHPVPTVVAPAASSSLSAPAPSCGTQT